MKFKMGERGFVLAEFAIALPLLILLLYALGMVTLHGLKIAREQVADYTLETDAQYVIDRITSDARAAQYVRIKNANDFDEIIFYCYTIGEQESDDFIAKDGKYYKYRKEEIMFDNRRYYKNILDPRIYRIDNRDGGFFRVYFKHSDDDYHSSPLTGDSTYGDHYITEFKVDRDKLNQKILHLTLEMKSNVTKKKVKFTTSVFMPACESFKVPSE
ncbi:MAG: hypothetical protein J5809_00065 [Selenomonadaceae bacterium]|nr:hypothetical protein [Selenomonadaceae bacterium]